MLLLRGASLNVILFLRRTLQAMKNDDPKKPVIEKIYSDSHLVALQCPYLDANGFSSVS